jgi:hypothetical protein
MRKMVCRCRFQDNATISCAALFFLAEYGADGIMSLK